jgi:predicted CoA-binding protein
MTTAHQARVDDFLAQTRIAVAGVSARPGAAGAIWRRLKAQGHVVFAVNPNLASFEGEPCHPDVGSIPGGVDGVVIVTRPQVTEAIVRDCAAAGVPRVWMHQSSGRPTPGTSVSPEAVRFCADHGIAVIAGTCPMMYGPDVDFGHRCMRWMLGASGGAPK